MIKRKVTRIGASVAAVTAVALVAAACSASSPSSDDDQSADGSITFSNWQWLAPGSGEALWTALSEAYEGESDVLLERSETPFGQYANKLNTELGAGGGPDVFVVGDVQFETLAAAGVLEPLDDAVADATLNSTNDSLVIEEEQLGVTWEQVGYALVGNRNVMEQAGIGEMPTTVDELIEAAGKAVATGASGLGMRHQMSDFGAWYVDYSAWPYGFGGSFSDDSELTLDSSDNVEGLREYARVLDSAIVPIGDDASTFRSKFKENQLAFVIDNSGAVLSFTEDMPGQDIVAAPLPFPEGGQNQHLILAVNANSENKAAAMDFVSWILSDEGQTILREQRGASTLASDVPLSPDFASENPWAQTYVDTAGDTRSGRILGFEEDTEPIMRVVMQAVERVIADNEDPKKALEQAQAEAEQEFGN